MPEQPSPLLVLPSSHCSLPSITPSPHLTTGQTHNWPGVQTQPAPLVLQSAEQPSPSFVLPSSHTSPSEGWTMPSPQRGAGLQGAPGVGQTQPLSSWQVLLQPSPLLRVAVVALLARLDALVATLGDAGAGLSGDTV